MAGLDLSGVQQTFEAWLVDEIEITRSNGSADDTLNEETGRLVGAPDRVIYDALGAVLPWTANGLTSVPDPDLQRRLELSDAKYRLLLPLAADAPTVIGDSVRVKATHSATPDPLLTTRLFEVVELAEVSSMSVLRTIYLKQVGVLPATP